MGMRRWRCALYSHDTVGMGHMRRNQLIAEALAFPPFGADVLLIAGAREANAFRLPPGVDCLSLPGLQKGADGGYGSRSLDMPLHEMISLRAGVIRAALEAFEPDVLIVDKVARGACRELDPSLAALASRGRTRCVLGLRDVLDDPETVRREWAETATEEAVSAYYDAIWVYGDPAVYNPVREYGFTPQVAGKVRYTGYLDRCRRPRLATAEEAELPSSLGLPPGPLVLCMVGGGQDGARLADTFAQAELPPGTNAVILTGPFMPVAAQRALRRRAAMEPRLRVLEFVTHSEWYLGCADRVVAMGGYNSVCEVLSSGKPSLIVPRVQPRSEQLIRAERLSRMGLLEMLLPEDVTPRALTRWLARTPPPPTATRGRIDLDGLERLPRLLDEMLSSPPVLGIVPSFEGAAPHVAR